jgi:NhaP-type Na+/H+ or K+/H+ antiporter
LHKRFAATLALVAFATCLLAGAAQSANSFTTTVYRALLAMAGTYALGLILGAIAQKMLDENLQLEEQKLRNSRTKLEPDDR